MSAEKPARYRLKDKEKKHVKPKPPRAAGKPKWDEDRPPRSRTRGDGEDRPPRKRYDSDDRPPPRKRFDDDRPARGPKREWSDRPPRREFGDGPRGRSAGPKREWSDRPPRREFSDRAPRSAGGGNAEVMEALARIENAVKDIVKRITLIENQLDEIFDGDEE